MSKRPTQPVLSVMFICLGNICRSPSAEWVFKEKAEAAGLLPLLRIESSGTLNYHAGNPADARTVKTASLRGIDMSRHCAQQLTQQHIATFDYLLVMDRMNDETVRKMAPKTAHHKIGYFLSYGSLNGQEVPDPYYQGAEGFEHVLDLIENAADGLLAHVQDRLKEERVLLQEH
jgi:protein-tyrosine phosphatase